MHGFLLIDKPDGLTSHDVVNRVRRLTGEKRVGHAGTLDPFATGLLIVGVGREATREFSKLVGLDKEYEATFMFGGTSDTDDRTGKIETVDATKAGPRQNRGPALDQISLILQRFVGPIEQVPPAYSAIKIGGKKMYEAAREGKPLEAKPRSVTIHSFDLLGSAHPEGSAYIFRIRSSSGTYIRSLARDLGAALGTGGYVEELRRTAIGPFRIEQSVPLKDLSPDTVKASLLPIGHVLSMVGASATVNG